MNVTWVTHDAEFATELRAALFAGLEAAADEAQAMVQEAISLPPPPSRPGEPPHQDSGVAHASVGVQQVGAISDASGSVKFRVGYPDEAKYMGMHESGINYAKAGFQQRKSLEPTILNGLDRLADAFIEAAGE